MYKKARKLFHEMEINEQVLLPLEEGRKIRAALHVIVGRNDGTKIFKTKTTKEGITIWRRL